MWGGVPRALATVALVLGVVACGGPSMDVVAGTPGSALIDRSTGTIQLPLEQYGPSPQEEGVHRTARSIALSRCMTDAGHPGVMPFTDLRTTPPPEDRRYGVWVRAGVERDGYAGALLGRGPLLRQESVPGLTVPQAAAYRHCLDDAASAGLALPPPPPGATAAPARPPSPTPAAQEVVHEWETCLAEHGVGPPSPADPWVPAGVSGRPKAEQVRIGLVDVGCKEDLDVVARLADLDAQAQLPLVQDRQDELNAYRDAVEAVLDRSEALIATAPEVR